MKCLSSPNTPFYGGQADSPESPGTPEIMEIVENFIKVTKDVTKLKDTLAIYDWEKCQFKKQ